MLEEEEKETLEKMLECRMQNVMFFFLIITAITHSIWAGIYVATFVVIAEILTVIALIPFIGFVVQGILNYCYIVPWIFASIQKEIGTIDPLISFVIWLVFLLTEIKGFLLTLYTTAKVLEKMP